MTEELTEELTADDFEQIVLDHDPRKDMILDALLIVKNYIMEHKLILTGGMSIDMALRNKGKFIYKDTKLPDYDFYSPEFHKDAYKIAEILAEKYVDVNVINATHVSTMRVRINSTVVADCTYVPKNVFDRIPTISLKTNKGIKFVHPWYQMIDQHRALSLPFENAPRESIWNRWKKDIERYNLLSEEYPVELPKIKVEKLKQVKYKVDFDLLDGECITGYVGLLYWIHSAVEDGFTSDVLNSTVFKPLKITNSEFIAEIPDSAYFTILTDNFEELLKKIKGEKKYYNELLDKIPRKILVEGKNLTYEILDNRGSLRTTYKPFLAKRIWISNLQGIMCYLLTLGVFYKSPLAQHGYYIAQEIIAWAVKEFCANDLSTAHSGKSGHTKYHKYLPSVETYGQFNFGYSHQSSKQREMSILGIQKEPYNKPHMAKLDLNGSVNEKSYEFDSTKSEFYHIDGLECEEFKMVNY